MVNYKHISDFFQFACLQDVWDDFENGLCLTSPIKVNDCSSQGFGYI